MKIHTSNADDGFKHNSDAFRGREWPKDIAVGAES